MMDIDTKSRADAQAEMKERRPADIEQIDVDVRQEAVAVGWPLRSLGPKVGKRRRYWGRLPYAATDLCGNAGNRAVICAESGVAC